jgi:hypothetical protein
VGLKVKIYGGLDDLVPLESDPISVERGGRRRATLGAIMTWMGVWTFSWRTAPMVLT